MAGILFLLYIFSPIATLLLVVRLICSPFSAEVSKQVKDHQLTHLVWGIFALIGIAVLMGKLSPEMWPPRSLERREQRAKVIERVQSAGGWPAIQKACETLVMQHQDDQFQWFYRDTNDLPPAIAALKPKEIIYYPPKILSPFSNKPKIPIVHIKIFGSHSTGGHSTPYFGLEVICTTNTENYRPSASIGGASGNHYDSYNRVTDTIYEIY